MELSFPFEVLNRGFKRRLKRSSSSFLKRKESKVSEKF